MGFDPRVTRTFRLKAFMTWRGKVEMSRACGTYGRQERRIQDVGGEA
jgi:hypothetical protein